MISGNVDVLCCAAICQRHVLESAHELHSQQEELQEMLLEFFEQHLQEHFPETSYTFDVYITTAGRVRSQKCLPAPQVNVVSERCASDGETACTCLAKSPQLASFCACTTPLPLAGLTHSFPWLRQWLRLLTCVWIFSPEQNTALCRTQTWSA